MSNLSPTEAVKKFEVSKPTLYNDMKVGKLSYTIDGKDKRKINIAELQRVYKMRDENQRNEALNIVNQDGLSARPNVKEDMVPRTALLEKEIELLKIEAENKKEEAEKWEAAFNKAQETAQKITLLLEHQDKNGESGDWGHSLKSLEDRVANQENVVKEAAEREEKALEENKKLKRAYQIKKRALDHEQSKSFFQKVFSSK